MALTPWARRLAGYLVVAVAVLGIAHLVMHRNRAWFETLPGGIWQWFDLNAEASVGTWFSTSVLFLVGVAAALAAAGELSHRRTLSWVAIAVTALVLSLDDKISAHERLPEFFALERSTMATHEWLLPGVVIAGVGIAVLVYVARTLPTPVRRGLRTALALFLLGAIVIEALSGYFVRELAPSNPLRASLATWVLVEETLEMLGAVLALAVVHTHLDRRGLLSRTPRHRAARGRQPAEETGDASTARPDSSPQPDHPVADTGESLRVGDPSAVHERPQTG